MIVLPFVGSSWTFWEATVPYTDKAVGLFLGNTLRRPALVTTFGEMFCIQKTRLFLD